MSAEAAPAIIRLAATDDVAVALRDLPAGGTVEIDGRALALLEPIPLGHKLALRPIAQGEKVLRFGVPIGRASAPIAAGAHVHVHNLESAYITNAIEHFED
jgi:altronate hydrolase